MNVNRSELKYFLNRSDIHVLRSRLLPFTGLDKYSLDTNGYSIRSLYFDSYDDLCLQEKLAGNISRKKYRIRIYNLQEKVIKFEIKHKINQQIFKESTIISKDICLDMIQGRYQKLRNSEDPVLKKIYPTFISRNFKPKVIIDYERLAFHKSYFNLRITIDQNLRCNFVNFDIFNKKLITKPVNLEERNILEVKYNIYFPDHLSRILSLFPLERMAISKYTLCRSIFKTRKWEDN